MRCRRFRWWTAIALAASTLPGMVLDQAAGAPTLEPQPRRYTVQALGDLPPGLLEQMRSYGGEHPWATLPTSEGVRADNPFPERAACLRIGATAHIEARPRVTVEAWVDAERVVFEISRATPGGHPTRQEIPYIVARWDEVHLLVAESGLPAFANSVNQGNTLEWMRDHDIRIVTADRGKPAAGLPVLPGRFQPWILRQPVDARVIAVGESVVRPAQHGGGRFHVTPVTLDAGADRGLLAGMELLVYEPYRMRRARVVEVGATTCEAEVLDMRAEGFLPEVPRMGWKLSTRPPGR